MAITVTNRHASHQATDLASYSFAITSLNTSGRWLVIDVFNQRLSGSPGATPSLSGGGLSYTMEVSQTLTTATAARLTRFYAWNPSSSSLTLVVDLSGETQTCCNVQVQEIDGAHTTSPFVAANTIVDEDFNTSPTVVMNAYSHADNRFVMISYHGANEAVTCEHTALASSSGAPSAMVQSQWSATVQDTTPDMSWTSSVGQIAIASEIRVPDAAPTTRRLQTNVSPRRW